MISVAIHGAAGRMGLRLAALCREDAALEMAAAIDRPDHPALGQDIGVLAGVGPVDVPLADALPGRPDVLIDFSTPPAVRAVMGQCVASGTNMVIGTTGLADSDHALIDEAAGRIGVLQAPNMSLGVNLLFALAAEAARRLGPDYDIEIVEAHHRYKKDAPSGTALGIAEAVCAATGRDPRAVLAHGRHGEDAERRPGEIGMHALRSGDVVGRHTVSFGALGEEVQLAHVAGSRDIFVRGALSAAKWMAGKAPGRYRIADVLGL